MESPNIALDLDVAILPFNISIKVAVFGICFHFTLYSHIFFLYLLQIRIEINSRRIVQWEIWSSFKTQFVTKINTRSLWYITACFPTPRHSFTMISLFMLLYGRKIRKFLKIVTKLVDEHTNICLNSPSCRQNHHTEAQ